MAKRGHDHAACYTVRGVLTSKRCRTCKIDLHLEQAECYACALKREQAIAARMSRAAAQDWVRPLSAAERATSSLVR